MKIFHPKHPLSMHVFLLSLFIPVLLVVFFSSAPTDNTLEAASKYKSSEVRVAYSLYRLENSEIICYYSGFEGGISCKWKDK